MTNKLQEHTEKAIFDFEMTFEERLLALEQSYQNHHGDAWKGMTIQAFIKQALQERDAIIVDLLEQEKFDWRKNMDMDQSLIDWYNSALDKAIELIGGKE